MAARANAPAPTTELRQLLGGARSMAALFQHGCFSVFGFAISGDATPFPQYLTRVIIVNVD